MRDGVGRRDTTGIVIAAVVQLIAGGRIPNPVRMNIKAHIIWVRTTPELVVAAQEVRGAVQVLHKPAIRDQVLVDVLEQPGDQYVVIPVASIRRQFIGQYLVDHRRDRVLGIPGKTP